MKAENKSVEKHGSAGRRLKIIIAGGGTGGHIFPAIAIANALKKLNQDVELLFVGAKGKMEMEKVPQAGYAIQGIDIAGFNRSSLIKNMGLPFKLLKSFLQVKKIMRSFQPDAVIGVGGYSSFPVLRYAQSRHLPNFIHESNAFAGKSNRLLAKKATRIFVATDGMQRFFPKAKIMVTGNPVRASIVNSRIRREEGIGFFGLDPTKKTVFSMGGSLGAKNINEAMGAGLEAFEENELQLIWQTGRHYSEQARELASEKKNVWTGDFINRIEYAFAAADLVVSRAGAMSIAELCVVKKPVVFVPFPFAAEDHQTSNAQVLVNARAGLMIKDNEAKEKLVETVLALARDGQQQQVLSSQIGRLAITDADDRIARTVLDLMEEKGY